MKIKCVKLQCPICSKNGSCQIFFNKQNKIKYGRVRHYTGLNESKKPQFEYCKIEDLTRLETLLKSLDFQFPTVKATESLGQTETKNIHDLAGKPKQFGHLDSSLISRIQWAGSSARIEHHPPKSSRNIDLNINLTEYREYLLSKFSRSYALQLINNGIKYSHRGTNISLVKRLGGINETQEKRNGLTNHKHPISDEYREKAVAEYEYDHGYNGDWLCDDGE